MKIKLLLIALVLLGGGVRLYGWEMYPFGFDQVQILENAMRITEGTLTLIGPRTGPAPLFTGPLIYYWTAGWLVFVKPPLTLIWSTTALHLISGIVFAVLTKRYISNQAAVIAMGLWSMAAYMVQLDRIPWNPNIMFIASTCVFVPLVKLIDRRTLLPRDFVLISLGILLGYQAHLSGLLLYPFALAGLVLSRSASYKHLLILSLVFLLSLLPALAFDVRHDWLHVRGILSLLQFSSPNSVSYVSRAVHDVMVSMENGGKFWLLSHQFAVKVMAGVFVLGIGVINLRFKKRLMLWFGLWLVGTALIYAWYKGEKPEYYFGLQLPIWILWMTYAFMRMKWWIKMGLLGLFITGNVISLEKMFTQVTPLGFQEQREIAAYVNQKQPVKVEYYMPHATNLGLEYLIHPTTDSASRTIIIEYPKNETSSYSYQTQTIGIIE